MDDRKKGLFNNNGLFSQQSQNEQKPFSFSQSQNANNNDNPVAQASRVGLDLDAGLYTPEPAPVQDTLTASENKPFNTRRNDVTGFREQEQPRADFQPTPQPASELHPATQPARNEADSQKPISFTKSSDNDVARAALNSLDAERGLHEPDPATADGVNSRPFPIGQNSGSESHSSDATTAPNNSSQPRQEFQAQTNETHRAWNDLVADEESSRPIQFGKNGDNEVAKAALNSLDAERGLYEPAPTETGKAFNLGQSSRANSGNPSNPSAPDNSNRYGMGLHTMTGESLHAQRDEIDEETLRPIPFNRNGDNEVAKVALTSLEAERGIYEQAPAAEAAPFKITPRSNAADGGTSFKKVSGGNLHFDEVNNADSVNRLNRAMDSRDWRNRHLRPLANAASKPMEHLADQAKGDEESREGLRKMEEYGDVIPAIFGGTVDQSGIDSLIASIAKQDAIIKGGDALEQILKGKAAPTNSVSGIGFDFEDYLVFTEAQKHPEMNLEGLRTRAKEKNAKFKAKGIEKTISDKQKNAMEKALRMNRAETYAEGLMMTQPGLFSEAEREILKSENSLFNVTNMADFKLRDDLINKVLTRSKLEGELGKINWKKASSRDISDILKGKKGFRITDEKLKGLLEAKLNNIEKMQKLRELGKRKAARQGAHGLLLGRLGREVMKDEDLSAASTVMNASTKGMALSGKIAAGGTKLGYKTARATGKAAGKAGITVTKKAGANAVAELIEKLGLKCTGLETAIGSKFNAIKNTPKNAIKGTAKLTAKGAATIGHSILNTSFARKITGSRAGKLLGRFGRTFSARYTSLKKMLGKVMNTVLAPLRFVSNAANFVKRKILLPVAVAGGVLFIIELVIGFFAGMQSNTMGGGAVVTIILDEKEHFEDFQKKYDEQDSIFQSQVNSVINSPAQTKNLKGETIGYGINTAEVKNSDGSKTLASQYQNGLHLGYFYDGNSTTGVSSNIEDILSAMAVIMSQDQSNHHDEALGFIEAAYKSSHAYTTHEADLYQCANGCTWTKYYCNDFVNDVWYANSDLKYKPWTYGDYVKPTAKQECSVCKAAGLPYNEYAGCTVTGTCYHGDRVEGEELSTNADDYSSFYEFDERDDEKASEYYTEYVKPQIVDYYPKAYPDGYNSKGVKKYVLRSEILEASGLDSNCDSFEIITLSRSEDYVNKDGHDRTHTEDCGYVAVCKGHDHYGCPDGHEIATCYGHTDLYMNVYVSSLNKLFEMGGVPINENATVAVENQVYGMDKDEFDKLSPEEQEKVIEDYTNKLNNEGGGTE